MTLETRMKISAGVKRHLPRTIFKKGEKLNEDHPNWKGNKVSYVNLHTWIRRRLGVPSWCEHCGRTDGYFEWASKSHQAKRDSSDYISLCKSCHSKYDGLGFKSWETRRKRYGYSGRRVAIRV